jgi:hypothetical protein
MKAIKRSHQHCVPFLDLVEVTLLPEPLFRGRPFRLVPGELLYVL